MMIRARYWHTRALLVGQVLSTMLITYAEPGSLSHRLLQQSGGWLWVAMLSSVALLAVADIVVNDLMPEPYVLPTVKRRRYVVYLMLAACLYAVGGVIGASPGGKWVLLHYTPLGCWAVLIAVTDFLHVHRRPVQRARHEPIDPPTMPRLAR